MRERVSFSTVKISHSLSTVFDESVYNKLDQRWILAEFKAKSCLETNNASEEMMHDKGHQSVEVYLECAK